MTFGQRLCELRKSRNIEQKKLAEKIHVSPSTISNYEKGLRHPDIKTLCSIADYFQVSTDFLLGRSTMPTNKRHNPLDLDTDTILWLRHEIPDNMREDLKAYDYFLLGTL